MSDSIDLQEEMLKHETKVMKAFKAKHHISSDLLTKTGEILVFLKNEFENNYNDDSVIIKANLCNELVVEMVNSEWLEVIPAKYEGFDATLFGFSNSKEVILKKEIEIINDALVAYKTRQYQFLYAYISYLCFV